MAKLWVHSRFNEADPERGHEMCVIGRLYLLNLSVIIEAAVVSLVLILLYCK